MIVLETGAKGPFSEVSPASNAESLETMELTVPDKGVAAAETANNARVCIFMLKKQIVCLWEANN